MSEDAGEAAGAGASDEATPDLLLTGAPCPACGSGLRLSVDLVASLPPQSVLALRGTDEWEPEALEALERIGRSDVLVVLLTDEETIEVLDENQMAAAGWIRKPA